MVRSASTDRMTSPHQASSSLSRTSTMDWWLSQPPFTMMSFPGHGYKINTVFNGISFKSYRRRTSYAIPEEAASPACPE